MRQKPKRILLAMGWYDHRVAQGIAKFAEEAGWHLCADVTREKVIPWGWDGDGILAWLGAGDDLAEFVVQAKLPTVDFSYRRPHLPYPRVLTDQAAAARLAAEYFLTRGMRHFLFYSDTQNWSFDEVGAAFVAAITAAGHPCPWLRWHESPSFTTGRFQWQEKLRWLAEQLTSAPKPLAVFAATDDHALEVIETCEVAGIAVPEQVSIIGVDNSLLAVEAMRTPVTSIDRNLPAVGYAGASLLARLMNQDPPPAQPIRIPPLGLITRKSSDLLALNHPGVAKSLRYMWANCHRPIAVNDLVAVAAMSRSALHQAFLDQIGRPPGRELQRIRLENAKKMLAQTAVKLATVAHACGFQNANTFWVAFRQATGLTPKQYQSQFCLEVAGRG